MKFFNALFLVSLLVNASFAIPMMTPQEEAESFARMRQALEDLGRERALEESNRLMQTSRRQSDFHDTLMQNFHASVARMEALTAQAERVKNNQAAYEEMLRERAREAVTARSHLAAMKSDQERTRMIVKFLGDILTSFSVGKGPGGKLRWKSIF
jgi:ribosomal protein L17